MADSAPAACLPCPFCGGLPRISNREATISETSSTGERWFIACYCGGYIAHAWQSEPTEAEAVAAWNRRAPSPTPAQLEAAAEAAKAAFFGGDFGDRHTNWPAVVRAVLEAVGRG